MGKNSNTTPKKSYRVHFGKDGTVYRQRITLPRSTFNTLRDAIQSEIALGYPQKKKYAETSGDEFYLSKLTVIQGKGNFCYVELNHTQTRFINLFLKLKLGDFNTYLVFK